MKTFSLDIALDYAQIREIVNQLPEEDKWQLKDELIAEFRRKKLESFQYENTNEEENLPSLDEIQTEINEVRRELYEKRNKNHR